MARILNNKTKRQEFLKYVLREDELLRITNRRTYTLLLKRFNIRILQLDFQYSRELIRENQIFNKLKRKQNYRKLTRGLSTIMYKPGVERVCQYITSPTLGTAEQKEQIQSLYATENANDDKSTYNGKITFN
jgi:hypothetical protein